MPFRYGSKDVCRSLVRAIVEKEEGAFAFYGEIILILLCWTTRIIILRELSRRTMTRGLGASLACMVGRIGTNDITPFNCWDKMPPKQIPLGAAWETWMKFFGVGKNRGVTQLTPSKWTTSEQSYRNLTSKISALMGTTLLGQMRGVGPTISRSVSIGLWRIQDGATFSRMRKFTTVPCIKSDHAPLILNFESLEQSDSWTKKRSKSFRFEKVWLEKKEECDNVVTRAWDLINLHHSFMDRTKNCGVDLRLWGSISFGSIRKKIKLLEEKIKELQESPQSQTTIKDISDKQTELEILLK